MCCLSSLSVDDIYDVFGQLVPSFPEVGTFKWTAGEGKGIAGVDATDSCEEWKDANRVNE